MATHSVLNNLQVLVIDDEPDLRVLYELTLLREGYGVHTAATVAEAQSLLAARPFDLVITDMRLPDGMGTAILHTIKSQLRSERCIVITAYGSAENAVESLKAGAFDYLTKPVDLKQFRNVVAAAAQAADKAVKQPTKPFRTSANEDAMARLAGNSASMRSVKERITKVARSMAPVLIRGESGTGKELVANALHASSHRFNGPWVAVNCGAIPENLLEAEFFGSKKGAYTGSAQDREGFFRAASGGTLFLDEIGDLPLAMQAKLLRAIQERCIRPLGSNQEESVDVRIVSATHKNLPLEVADGRFRQDLFYRLNVIDIYIPPLRERSEDLPVLCEALLRRIAHESGVDVPQMPANMLTELQTLPLDGNVRELENLLHRALALAEDGVLCLDIPVPKPDALNGLPQPLGTKTGTTVVTSLPEDLQGHLDQQERDILVRTLKVTGFNRTVAANRLGLSLRQIRYRIARLKIDTPNTQEDESDAA
ncbi:MAG: type 4 fimbriae expression regulatory protein PilR [Pseudomonadota bacterium]|jgi:two-component system response regulator PilR (NtrC family)